MDAMKLKMKGKRSRGIPILRWLDNIDNHLKGMNTSLNERSPRNEIVLRIEKIGGH